MKHGSIKSFLAGVLVAVLVLGLALPAAAAATTKTANLYYNDIKIRLNGKEITPKDAAGNVVEPFTINGTTYLPVRAVGEALGLNVDWDSSTRTVILGNDPQSSQPAAWLDELDTFTGGAFVYKVFNQQYDDYLTANNGDTFDRSYITDTTEVSYLLNGQYKRFTGTYYLTNLRKDTDRHWRLLVYADDVLIYTSQTLTSGVDPIKLSVDLTNCNKLKLVSQREFSDGSSWYDLNMSYLSDVAIGNAALWTN